MSQLPKLKVKWWFFGCPGEETTCDLEQARDVVFDYRPGILIFVEGEMVNSYEELAQVAAQDQHKDKEALDVALVFMEISGG